MEDRVAGKANPHESKRHLNTYRLEAVLLKIQFRETVLCRRGEQRAVVTIGPAVIRAGNAPGTSPGPLQQPRPSVPTHVAKGAYLTGGIPQHDHAVGAELECQVVAGGWNLADVTGYLPARTEDPFDFESP